MSNKHKLIFLSILFFSCKEKLKEVDFKSNNCQGYPAFMKQKYSNSNGYAFSTTETRKKGLWLVNPLKIIEDSTRLIFQDETWKMGGWLGPLLTDKDGNIWCAPIPVVNILDNPTAEQNNLYRVIPETGKMELFIKLPGAENVNEENPYGILGLAYNCESSMLYVSTVAGSTRKIQKGKIYAINIKERKIESTLDCGDAFGMGVSFKDGFRKLYFGSARNSDVFSIALNKNGTFNGEIDKVFSVETIGVRGDDKIRKIKEDKQGNLVVSGIEFNYNLTAPTEKQETIYNFFYNLNTEKWEFKN
jgi:hypothetical protein